MKKTNKKGFTLVELVIVIAVIAILAGVLIGTFASVITRANQSKAVQEVKAAVDEAYVEYVAENHKAPESIKVTFGTDGKKFASVEFGEKTSAGFASLDADGYIALNTVDNQDVYFNWDFDAKGSTYSVETTYKGSELDVKTTIKAYVEAQLVTGAKYYKLSDDKSEIEFSATTDTGFVAVATPLQMTFDDVDYNVTFTINAEVATGVESVAVNTNP